MDRTDAPDIEILLNALWDAKGSDLLLTPGTTPLIRVDGVLRPVEGTERLTPADTESLLYGLLTSKRRAFFEEGKEIDFSFSWENQARFRVNGFRQRGSVAVAMRMIPYDLPSFTDIRLPTACRDLVSLPHGLVLVTGPTGSGKSTTLAAMIDWVNTNRAYHILTIEDPIEYVHRHKMSAVNQREVGEDTDSFPRALRSALREDPDVLLVGEMRDLETIKTALTIAETGHLVFATLHTNDSSQAIDRIIDVFPGDQQDQIRVQLASALQGVVYQRLVPRIMGGRAAAYEVLLATTPVKNLIREGKARQLRNIVMTSSRLGMQTLEMSLAELVAEGLVSPEAATAVSLFPSEIVRPQPPTG